MFILTNALFVLSEFTLNMLNWPTIKVAKFSVILLDIVSYADESALTRSYTAVIGTFYIT